VPTWFLCQNLVELGPVSGEAAMGFVLAARSTSPSLTAALSPDLGMARADFPGGAVRVTGHYDDPAAQTCLHTELQADDPAQEEAVRVCRLTFVIGSVQQIVG
jgi:hypothetical protein